MEEYIGLQTENEERDKLPISPLEFGNGVKSLSGGDGHLVICIKEGSAMLSGEDGDEELFCGTLVFARRGVKIELSEKSEDFSVEYVLFDASEDFLDHLELSDIAIGEAGEGATLSSVTKMSPYALEYYHDRLRICAAVYGVLAKIAREGMISRLERFDTLSDRLSPAMLQIEQRYMESLTVRTLAHSCSMSEGAFTRSFKRVYGCTPVQYLIRVRLEAAKELLASTDRSFEDIAKACGFRSAKYFGDMLKKNEHVTPRELRAMYQGLTQIRFF
ncbi:MAG: helix-turn-helix transcriptional regulator [Clostridia bacterium]|nr:helix-turn-helix transcriptional regulator [Clostridia bacterium]